MNSPEKVNQVADIFDMTTPDGKRRIAFSLYVQSRLAHDDEESFQLLTQAIETLRAGNLTFQDIGLTFGDVLGHAGRILRSGEGFWDKHQRFIDFIESIHTSEQPAFY